MAASDSMPCMSAADNQEAIQQRVAKLTEYMSAIRRNQEKLMAENQRLREVVRLAESELRKRRDQVQTLESELQGIQSDRLDAKARVESAIEKLDHLMAADAEKEES
jgi:septation ring formation regulator EzrA